MISLKILTNRNASKDYPGWINDPETHRFLTTKSITPKQAREFIAEHLDNPLSYTEPSHYSPKNILLGIFLNRKHIGNVRLSKMTKTTANVGILIGKKYWGKGYGTQALKKLNDYASDMGLERLCAGVFSFNLPSKRVLEKCGYKLEGISRNAVFKNGKLLDEFRYAKLRD